MVLTEDDRAEIARIVEEFGLEADEIRESHGSGPGSVTVTVLVDGDAEFGLDELGEISAALDPAAQSWGPASTTIVLEVSSRGVDAPLTRPVHWRRNRGRRVELRFDATASVPDVVMEQHGDRKGAPTAEARIGDLDADGDRVWLVFRSGKEVLGRWVALDAISRAVVQVEFSAPAEREVAALVADS